MHPSNVHSSSTPLETTELANFNQDLRHAPVPNEHQLRHSQHYLNHNDADIWRLLLKWEHGPPNGLFLRTFPLVTVLVLRQSLPIRRVPFPTDLLWNLAEKHQRDRNTQKATTLCECCFLLFLDSIVGHVVQLDRMVLFCALNFVALLPMDHTSGLAFFYEAHPKESRRRRRHIRRHKIHVALL